MNQFNCVAISSIYLPIVDVVVHISTMTKYTDSLFVSKTGSSTPYGLAIDKKYLYNYYSVLTFYYAMIDFKI